MRYKFFFLSALLAIAGDSSIGETTAGSVKGFVRDRVKNPPANGLSGAKVWLRLAIGKPGSTVITDTDGQYQIVNVANGQYTLVVAMVGYAPNPHEGTTIKVEGEAKAADVFLMQAYANSAYYSVVAAGIIKKVGTDSAQVRGQVFANEWVNLRQINLPPSSKAIVASELQKQDPSATQVLPDLKDYLTANPEVILKLETLFGQALAGKGNLPGKDSLNDLRVTNEVVADVVLFQIKGSSEPEGKRKVFINEFLLKWDNTPASKRFITLQKLDLKASR